jgi:hypothetical protein
MRSCSKLLGWQPVKYGFLKKQSCVFQARRRQPFNDDGRQPIRAYSYKRKISEVVFRHLLRSWAVSTALSALVVPVITTLVA